jgi:S-adenosylmethionine hydrolase
LAKPIVFLSDFGARDEFVGVCHCVIDRISPESRIIDLSHGVPPQDVRAGALILAESLQFAQPEVVALAVVDPGVGSERKDIAVETDTGHFLVGPDNGLLSLSWQELGGVVRAVEIDSPEVLLQPVSKVFHGRDVFAPAAAHLARGLPLDRVGAPLDPTILVSLQLAEPEVEPGRIRCEVLGVDRFGNVRLNVRPEHLSEAGLDSHSTPSFEVGTLASSIRARRVDTYNQVGSGEYGLMVDAWGWIALVRYAARASEELEAHAGVHVWIVRE